MSDFEAADGARRILVLDDDEVLLRLLVRHLTSRGFEVVPFSDAERALRCIAEHQVDCAVVDYSLDGTTGLHVLRRIREIDVTLSTVLLSGTIDVASAVEAIRLGAEDVLVKPPSMDLLQARIEACLDRTSRARRTRLLSAQLEDSWGLLDGSSLMQRLQSRIEHAALHDFPVLIVGEMGTTKKAVAEMIHRLSKQARDQLFAIELTGRPPAEVNTTLDQIRAFTVEARDSRRPPSLRAVHTLLLDHVAVLDPSTQSRLLELLAMPEPLRLILTARHDLLSDARAGRLDQTLHQRVAAFPILVPSLRERGSVAIALIATRMLSRLRFEVGEGPYDFTPQALDELSRYDWPGNFTQLRTVVEGCLVAAQDNAHVGVDHVRSLLPQKRAEDQRTGPTDDTTLAGAERRQISAVLQLAGTNRSMAARMLGITRTTLYKKLREFGIE